MGTGPGDVNGADYPGLHWVQLLRTQQKAPLALCDPPEMSQQNCPPQELVVQPSTEPTSRSVWTTGGRYSGRATFSVVDIDIPVSIEGFANQQVGLAVPVDVADLDGRAESAQPGERSLRRRCERATLPREV